MKDKEMKIAEMADFIYGNGKFYEEIRRETAKDFLQFVYDNVIDKHLIRKFEEFAKRFGVEMEDEEK